MSISSFQLHCQTVRWRLYGTSVSYARPARSSPSPQSHASTSSRPPRPMRCPPDGSHGHHAVALTGREPHEPELARVDAVEAVTRPGLTEQPAVGGVVHPAMERAHETVLTLTGLTPPAPAHEGRAAVTAHVRRRRARRRHSPRTTTIGTPPDSKLTRSPGAASSTLMHAYTAGPGTAASAHVRTARVRRSGSRAHGCPRARGWSCGPRAGRRPARRARARCRGAGAGRRS